MGTPRPLPLPVSYGHTDTVRNSGGYLINMEAEVAPPDARTPVTIRGTPGLALFCDTGDYPVVAMIENAGALYAVTKNAIYRIFPDGGSFKLGTFSLGLLVSASTNGLALVATDGVKIWSYTYRADEQSRYDSHAAFVDFAVELTNDPNYYPSKSVTFLDQYLIFERDLTNQFYNTGRDVLTVLGTAFSAAETNPDNLVAVWVDHQVLLLFGTKVTEFWYDTGVGDSPFQRYNGGVSEHGCASPYCLAKINNNTFVITPEATVLAYQGYTPRPVSTPAIEQELKQQDLTQATGFCYVDGGHFYYQLTAGDFTAVYDMSTDLWHVRESAANGRHIANCQAFAFNKNFVGSYLDGKIYHLSNDYTDEDGEPLIAKIVTGPLETAQEYAGIAQVELEVDIGVGNDDVTDPMIGMEVSRDDGKTFGNQRLLPLGKIGEYLTRVRWHRNGSARNPRFRFTISDAVRRAMPSRAWIELE